MSGPIASDIFNCVLSLTSPPVRWKPIGRPLRSVLRWILHENPPRERPSAWPCCPFCPGCRDMRSNHRAIEHLDQMRRRAEFGQYLEERIEYARTAEPPEPLPDAVPGTELGRQSTPSEVVHREVVHCFKKLAVVVPRLTTARLHRFEHFHHDRPVVFAHSRQHGPGSISP